MKEQKRFDVVIIGAGLIGLAVARSLASKFEGLSLLLLEKEHGVGVHQSSHNSGVIHSGLYYKPGSLKARLCVEGRESMYSYCDEKGVAYSRSGKLVIATRSSQLAALDELERRGIANGLSGLTRLDRNEIQNHEPNASGIAALYIPEAGVADYSAVAQSLANDLTAGGARIVTDHSVETIVHNDSGVLVLAGKTEFSAGVLVNCAGLHSDRVAVMAGLLPSVRIVPFRGEYYNLVESASDLVKALIYPVPDPRFPFLGVHFTRRVDGKVEVGPNAVMALGREHYRDTRANWRDVAETVTYGGFIRLASRNLWSGGREMINSRSTSLYSRLARQLVPELRKADLTPGGAGVRAQAVDPAGRLVDDFVIEQAGNSVHVLNAPSPGATASLAIGRHVARQIEDMI